MAHTPGPWEWDSGVIPPDGPGRYSDIYVDGGDKIIARVNEFREFSPAEGVANALLIVEAPNLAAISARAARQLEANAVCLNDPVFKAKTLALAEEIRAVLKAAGVDTDGGA